MKFIITVCVTLAIIPQIWGVTLENGNVSLQLQTDEDYTNFSVTLDGEAKISGSLGEGLNLQSITCNETLCAWYSENSRLVIQKIDSGFNVLWNSASTATQFQDCINLNSTKVHWFGGQERYYAQWPIESLIYTGQAYRSTRIESGAVAEPYWLNSNGGYISADERTPLFLEQNSIKNDSMCLVSKIAYPYSSQRSSVTLNYTLTVKNDAREAHQHAVGYVLGKPTGQPNERLVRQPIWTTWAKYKTNISDETIVSFAKDIIDHGFTGQLEIDDLWETCYGSLIFNDKFSNINSTVQTLKDLNFTVTLWTHPFVDDNCREATLEGQSKGYFVKNLDGNDTTVWWNSNNSHHIDFTNPAAIEWYVSRLKLIQDKHGIDSFKFDAGENDWAPEIAQLTGDVELAPNSLTEAYLRTVAQFGDLLEVRSGFRTQDLPIFVRMLDKDSRWGLNNGLHNLITTLLQMNLNGYTFVLPDMIGGNGYGTDLPTPEILVRWTQANVFMPSMQFSFLPWELISDEYDSLEIVRKFVNLHNDYSDLIVEAMQDCVANGTPVNAPIWWLDPTNEEALKTNDEFLLGEKILAAPVIVQGAVSRNVVLPKGSWKDGNNGTIYEGPLILENYPAPIDVLPYFIKQ